MKLSQNKIIKALSLMTSAVLGLYVIFLVVQLFSVGAPTLSNSVKGYSVYDLAAKPKDFKTERTLADWFGSKVIVEPTYHAMVELRFKSYAELFSLPAILYQLSQLIYWLSIGYLLLCIKMLFAAFSKDEVFSGKNTFIINSAAVVLSTLPMIRWLTKELFINCITNLNLNDSNYELQNTNSLFGTETLIGLAVLAFGLAFREGLNIKSENETFI